MRMRFAGALPAVVASIVAVGAIRAGELVTSGPKVGSLPTPFDVDDVTGPNRGKTLCYR